MDNLAAMTCLINVLGHSSFARESWDLCADKNAILSAETGAIYSPNYPYPIRYQLICHISVSQIDQMEYRIDSKGKATIEPCTGDSYLQVGNRRLCGNVT